MMIQRRRSGIIFSGSTEDLTTLNQEFEQKQCIQLPRFLEPELVDLINQKLENTQPHEVEEWWTESQLQSNFTAHLSHCLLNDFNLFKLIEKITNCDEIGCCFGRVYRMIPGLHNIPWHDDIGDDRLLGVSINLSPNPYQGAVLQVRNSDSGEILSEVANCGFGDAVIFRISPHLEHRLTPLEGTVSRTVYAGWFRSKPHYLAWLKEDLPNR